MSKHQLKFSALFITVLIVGLALSSNPPNARTNAPNESNCSIGGCHGNNPSSIIDGEISITGIPATVEANTTYDLTVNVEYTSGTPTRAGFQMVVLDDTDDNDFGSLSNAGSNSTITPSGGRTYFEHSTAMNFNGGTTVSYDVDWTAPAGPDGQDLTFYVASIIANGNGSPTLDKMKLLEYSSTLDASGGVYEVEVIQEDVSCFGADDGYVFLDITGGTPPFTFLFSNGETTNPAVALPVGIFDITIMDATGLTLIMDFLFMDGPSAPLNTFIVNSESTSCAGIDDGVIELNSSGGSPNYTYEWPDGTIASSRNNLAAGNYEVTTTDDHGCTFVDTYTVSSPGILTTDSEIGDITCFGASDGTLQLFTTGGTGTYSYSWSNGASSDFEFDLPPGDYTVTTTDENNCSNTTTHSIVQPEELITGADIQNLTCAGSADGIIDLYSSGGVGTYTYTWPNGSNNGIETNLAAGTYEITTTDSNDCLEIFQVTLSEPSPISITNSIVTDLQCNTLGSIEISTAGGTGALSATWSNNFVGNNNTNLVSGDYLVTITDQNNCELIQSFFVAPSDNIEYETEASNPSCVGVNDGSIELIFNSPSDYSSITWSTSETTTSISNLEPGSYMVTIEDVDFCSYVESFNLTSPEALDISLTPSNQILCFGDVINAMQIEASGGIQPYIYSGETSNIPAGTYNYSVTDFNGCVSEITFTTNNPTELTATVTTINTSGSGFADGQATINILGGTAPFSIDGNPVSTASITYSNLNAGLYNFTISDANDCTYSGTYTINEGIGCTLTGANIEVIQPECPGDEPEITITPIGGTAPYTYSIPADNFYEGNYTVIITDDDNCQVQENIAINYTDNQSPEFLSIDFEATYVNEFGELGDLNFEAQAIDNCLGPVNLEHIILESSSCDTFPNELLVQLLIFDQVGNTTETSVNVVVLDTFPPEILCQDDITISSCENFTLEDPLVTDNCGISIMETSGPDNLSIGNNTYTYQAFDFNGNATTCQTIVTVELDIAYDIIVTDASCFGFEDGAFEVVSNDSIEVDYENGLTENLSAGVYYFSILNGECSFIDSVIINQPEEILVGTIVTQLSEAGAMDGAIDVEVTGGVLPYTYTWFDFYDEMVGTGSSISGLPAGTYYCLIEDANACLAFTEEITITFETSVEDAIFSDVSLFPNPAINELFIDCTNPLDKIKVYDAQGKFVSEFNSPGNSINISSLNSGIYLIELNINEKRAYRKLIKQ